MKKNNKSPIFLLIPDSNQKEELELMLKYFNRGSQYVRDMALDIDLLNKVEIQPHVYSHLRTEFGLPSQIAVRAISNGIELAKHCVRSYAPHWRRRQNRAVGRPDRNLPAVPDRALMPMDDNIISYPNPFRASIRTLNARIQVDMYYCEYEERNDNLPYTLFHYDDRWSEGDMLWLHLPSIGKRSGRL